MKRYLKNCLFVSDNPSALIDEEDWLVFQWNQDTSSLNFWLIPNFQLSCSKSKCPSISWVQKVKFGLEESNHLAKQYQAVYNMSKCSWHFCVCSKNRGFTFKASYCEAKVGENWAINWRALPGCLIDFLLFLHKILTNFIQNMHSRCSELTHIYW